LIGARIRVLMILSSRKSGEITMRILIVGAGIGGLTLAALLRRWNLQPDIIDVANPPLIGSGTRGRQNRPGQDKRHRQCGRPQVQVAAPSLDETKNRIGGRCRERRATRAQTRRSSQIL